MEAKRQDDDCWACDGYGTTEEGPTPDTTTECMPCQGSGKAPKKRTKN